MKTKPNYYPSPPRGMKNPLAANCRFTICRLADGKERFSDRRPSLRKPWNWLVWDNEKNCEA